MSKNSARNPASLLEQSHDPKDLEARISGLRQQIVDLQRDLVYLEEILRALKRRQAPQAPSEPPLPAGVRPESKPRRLLGHWTLLSVLVLSFVLVYGGQYVLLKTNAARPDEGLRQALAGGMLIAGALLFGAFISSASHLLPRLEFPAVSRASFPGFNRWNLAWFSASIVLAIVAIILFSIMGESPLLRFIWLVSILALALAQIRDTRITWPRIVPEERMYLAALGVLLVITFIMRIYHLTTLPYNVDSDFANVGLQARALLTGQLAIFSYGWGSIPALGFLPTSITMSLFGNNLAGLNASGVIEGLLIIVGVYLLGRDLFHVRVGLLAAAFLTLSYAHMAAGRQAVYLDPVLVLVFAVYFLLIGLREDRGGPLVASGILTAFCMLVYYPGRIAVFILGFLLLYLFLFRRNWLQARWWAILLWGLAIIITFGPMLVVFARDFDGLIGRARTSSLLNPEIIRHLQNKYGVETAFDVVLQQARRSVLLFHYYPDTGTQFGFGRPLLDPFTAPLFALGLGYALFRWRQLGYALVIVWTVLAALTGSLLMSDAPNWPRLMILLPPTALLAALALNVTYELVSDRLEKVDSLARPLVPAAILLCLIVVGVLNWNTYIELKSTYAAGRTRIARYLADQPDSTKAYLLSTAYNYRDPEFQFLVPERLIANLTPEQISDEIPPLGERTLLIISVEQAALTEELQQRFPTALIEPHIGNSPNEVVFYSLQLPE
jgi:4-amino-4-deoxy-L-arabinose transferase-like glycosyltransferase